RALTADDLDRLGVDPLAPGDRLVADPLEARADLARDDQDRELAVGSGQLALEAQVGTEVGHPLGQRRDLDQDLVRAADAAAGAGDVVPGLLASRRQALAGGLGCAAPGSLLV